MADYLSGAAPGKVVTGGGSPYYPSVNLAADTLYANAAIATDGLVASVGVVGINPVVGVTLGDISDNVGFFGVTPVARPNLTITPATVVVGTGGSAVLTVTTFGGFTLAQIAAALLELGLLEDAAEDVAAARRAAFRRALTGPRGAKVAAGATRAAPAAATPSAPAPGGGSGPSRAPARRTATATAAATPAN
jgi:hypothetical protein